MPDGVAVVVRTSGSTGDPRAVLLSAAALRASAAATHHRLAGPGRWLLALPVDHVAGLQVLVRSVLAGTTPTTPAPGPFRPPAFVAAVATMPDDGPPRTPRWSPPSWSACSATPPRRPPSPRSTRCCSAVPRRPRTCWSAPGRPGSRSSPPTGCPRRAAGACTTARRSTASRSASTRDACCWPARCWPTATSGRPDLDADAFVQVDGVRYLRTTDLRRVVRRPPDGARPGRRRAGHRRGQGRARAGRGGAGRAAGRRRRLRRRRPRPGVGSGGRRRRRAASGDRPPDARRTPGGRDRRGWAARTRRAGSWSRTRSRERGPGKIDRRAAALLADPPAREDRPRDDLASDWVQGARPRTLPAAAAPVLVGTGAAAHLGEAHLGRAALALGVALALQVGVNYANDYSDGIRGTDVDRVGPLRLTASGTARPGTVKRRGVRLVRRRRAAGPDAGARSPAQWWLLAVGAVAIAAAWGYTGGQAPYGYRGLGEVGVFVFFGLVAVLGTTYTQAERALVAGVGRRGGHRPARVRAADGQQPARRAHRRPGRQADPGRADGRALVPPRVRGDGRPAGAARRDRVRVRVAVDPARAAPARTGRSSSRSPCCWAPEAARWSPCWPVPACWSSRSACCSGSAWRSSRLARPAPASSAASSTSASSCARLLRTGPSPVARRRSARSASWRAAASRGPLSSTYDSPHARNAATTATSHDRRPAHQSRPTQAPKRPRRRTE